MSAPAEAVVDLDAYRANLARLREVAPTAAQMAVVKADAYGHGAVEIAAAAREAGAEWLGVATLEEARDLRRAGDRGPVLAWLNPADADLAPAVDADVDVAAGSVEQLDAVIASGSAARPRVHLKVDTGMARGGVRGAELTALLEAAATAQRAGRIEIAGIFSHFACADEPASPVNGAQEHAFADAVAELASFGAQAPLRHLANSAAALTRPSTHLDMVRVGIASYGLSPGPAVGTSAELGLTPVMTLRTALALVRRVPAGTGVSYGHTYVTRRETTLGLIPVGYGDGLLRAASNRASALVNGVLVPVAGRVCMDQVVLDLGDTPARRGDEVVLFGPGHRGEPLAEDWAEAASTIGYEVLTRLGGRIARRHAGAIPTITGSGG
ncbi:alanine racemase [Mumia zhuanghuii]|uniref:Alanine racemase n=1 Tax=Mumia zhuanghuii TaxID=2585211 RepID=A0A5C4MZI0_9ACTN|nr:alanine racemase [Mumia zhuanghuii]TNC46517.1 alanine racemase [Mumia zhuanghuii]TNC50331.1 alanine racemase [Mumia zhuanghuii]